MNVDFEDKVAVVTGAASGIGRALALALARAGSDVVLADLDGDALRPVAAAIAALGRRALPVRCDVARDAEVERLAAEALATLGRVDILMNNAGIEPPYLPIEQVPLETWSRVLDVNVLGVVHGLRAFLPHMLARGSGYVVNTASIAGLVPGNPLGIPYTTSKFAVVGLSQGLALSLRPKGIGVSCLCPDLVRTGILAQSGGLEARPWIPPGTMVREPDEVAAITLAGMRAGQFLIFTQEEHQAMVARIARDLDAALADRIRLIAERERELTR